MDHSQDVLPLYPEHRSLDMTERDKQPLEQYNVYSSPFLELQTPFTRREAAKMLLLIWIIPIRLIAGLSAMILLAFCSFILAFRQDLTQPFAPWRRNLVVISSKLANVITLALGVRTRVTGYHHFKSAKDLGAIGIFNHSSYIDAVILMWLFAPSGVAMEFNANIPVVGTCIRAFQNIYVPRSSHGSAAKSLGGVGGTKARSVSNLIKERAKNRNFPMLVMAPEGTCGDGRCILQFRSGCFLPGVPLLPILFSYGKSHHNPAWTIIHEAWHFLRLLCQFWTPVDVKILPPYIPSPEEKEDPRLFSSNVRQLYSRELGVPLVEEGVPQFAALTKAGIRVSLDGRKIYGPPDVINADGFADLSKYA